MPVLQPNGGTVTQKPYHFDHIPQKGYIQSSHQASSSLFLTLLIAVQKQGTTGSSGRLNVTKRSITQYGSTVYIESFCIFPIH